MKGNIANSRIVIEENRIRCFAFLLALSIGILFSFVFVFFGSYRDKNSFETELDCKINPNEASIASMVRLVGIGIGRAGAIVAYREDFVDSEGNCRAFESCQDLEKVKGIGPKISENICDWLRF